MIANEAALALLVVLLSVLPFVLVAVFISIWRG